MKIISDLVVVVAMVGRLRRVGIRGRWVGMEQPLHAEEQ